MNVKRFASRARLAPDAYNDVRHKGLPKKFRHLKARFELI